MEGNKHCRRSREDFLDDLIQVMVCQEISRRRCADTAAGDIFKADCNCFRDNSICRYE